tara:strand:- start:843 stop:1523 length:681 start_codon:yes stop_codon:yes gene_type:complete
MKHLFVVYGSETKLLKGIFNFDDSYFLRIFNSNTPKKQDNALDLNSIDDFKSVFKSKLKELKPKRIVFIGAAFVSQNNLLLKEKEKNLQKMVNVNILNYVELCHFILPFMVKLKSGYFIYLSSFRSTNTSRGTSIYSASKAFGEKFFEVIGKENGIFGVYSTSIRMGYFDSRMTKNLGTEKSKEFILAIGNRRLGLDSDLIETIKYVLNNQYTNGGVIELTGGISY